MAPALMERGNKTKRVDVRVRSDMKETLEYAASLEGISVSDLMVSSAYEKAVATIRNHEVLQLSQQDSELFAQAVIQTAKSSDAFKKGAARYADMVMR